MAHGLYPTQMARSALFDSTLMGTTVPEPAQAPLGARPAPSKPAEGARALHAQITCETQHGRAHGVFEREVVILPGVPVPGIG